MNSKRPAAKPRWMRRRSSGSQPCRAQKAATRSAAATGPPLHRMFITAEPHSMRSVRRKTWCASWQKSVLSPTSPRKCGTTGRRLRFCTSVERCDSATQATP